MKQSIIFFLAALLGIINLSAQSQNSWPKEITVNKEYTISLYSPENSSYLDNKLESNLAFSVKKNEEPPVFGMIWLTSLLDIDRQSRVASLVTVKINEIRFSEEVSEDKKQKFQDLINTEIPKWNVEFSIDDLISSLDEVTADQDLLKNEPPTFLFAKEPTVLILIDGEPKFKEAENGYEVIINSSALIIKETKSNSYFLKGGDVWYSSKNINDSWTVIDKAPSSIRKIAKKAEPKEDTELEEKDEFDIKNPPKIIVSTSVAELITFDGEPDYAPIQNTQLLYAKNSQNDIFMHIKEQEYYALVSGRWFKTKELKGTWTYVEPDKLIEDFANIPKDSDKSNILSSVPGTLEAKNAVYDAQLPQTASVSRDTKATEVVYNGTPEFEKIKDLQLEYAVNTESDVFKDKNDYYLCDNAIWFKSNNANGPWKVADERPLEVAKIPADNPKYNTKYVYIYETSPQVVYVGYTPGYYGSYIYGPVMVYGTGYYYNPWYHGHYYHHHYTYGFSVRYNPWYGWSVGFRFGSPHYWYGFSYWGPGYHHWGPRYYRPPYYRRGYYGRPAHPIYRGRKGISHYKRPARPANRPNTRQTKRPSNPSNRPSSRPTNPSTRPSTRPSTPNINKPSTRPTTPSTRPTRPTTRPSTRPTVPNSRPATPSTRPSTRPSTPNMNRPSTRPSSRPSNRPTAQPSRAKVRSRR